MLWTQPFVPKVIDPRAAAAATSLVNQLVSYIRGVTGLEEVLNLAALVAEPRADTDALDKAERRRTATKAVKLSNKGSQKRLMNSNQGSCKPTVQTQTQQGGILQSPAATAHQRPAPTAISEGRSSLPLLPPTAAQLLSPVGLQHSTQP